MISMPLDFFHLMIHQAITSFYIIQLTHEISLLNHLLDLNYSQSCYLYSLLEFLEMFLQAVSAASATGLGPWFSSYSTSSSTVSLLSFSSSTSGTPLSLVLPRKQNKGFLVSAASHLDNVALTGVLFQPFEEVKNEEFLVPITPNISLARMRYSDECETAVNEQINVEYNVSYVYHSMYAYFDRDNVALKGLAKFFKESSDEEREHAEKLMKYQNIRGGRVKLHCITSPPAEFDHVDKGDALYAMELALSLEKLTNEKLLNLHSVADQNNDPQMTNFIESEFLDEQVEAIKKIAEYVTQLRMIGKGHGVWHFDQRLLREGDDGVF